MPTYSAPLALLPDGWAHDVVLEIDPGGTIGRVLPDSEDPGAHRLPGPVIPGMVNLHSHAFQRAMAGLAERGSVSPDSFWSWRDRMYGFVRTLTPSDIRTVATQLYVEMVRAGYTSVVEFHYLHRQPDGAPHDPPDATSNAILEAARAVGIGLTHAPTLYLTSGFGGAALTPAQAPFGHTEADILGTAERVLRQAGGDPGVRTALGLHSLRAVPPDALKTAVESITRLDPEAPIHIHVAEQTAEVEACVAWSGLRPVRWLLDHAPVDPRWCLVHATHMDDTEVRDLAGSGAVAGLCPTTEANLGDGVFRLRDYLDVGGHFGIGSDSHVSVDAAGELRLLEYGQRLTLRERNVVVRGEEAGSGRRLWESAARGGAQAAGRPVGSIEAGRRADWLVLDGSHPVLFGHPPDALLDAFVFCEGARPIREVWVGGERKVKDGRHVLESEAAEAYRAFVTRRTEG